MDQQKTSGLTLPMSILIAAVLISGSIIYLVGSKNQPAVPPAAVTQEPQPDFAKLLELSERDVILGEKDAPVTFIEYGDYQCPFCGRFFNQTEPLLRENYIRTGKVKMVYRDLAFLGPESQAAAEAAECAKDQGKFWAYHDELFKEEIADGREHNGNLNRELFLKLAERIGLDVPAFTSCVDSKKYADAVVKTTRSAQRLGIDGTPTSFINGEMVSGARPYASFQAIIDKHLSR